MIGRSNAGNIVPEGRADLDIRLQCGAHYPPTISYAVTMVFGRLVALSVYRG